MNKRGQVTSFIILGLVLLVIVFIVFYFLGDRLKQQGEINIVFDESAVEPIKNLVQECVEKQVDKGTKLVGKQGGYYDPVKYYVIGNYSMSYDCYKDNNGNYINRLPSLFKISREIEQYLQSDEASSEISDCINHFTEFENQGYNINEEDDMEISVDVNMKNIIVNVDYPLIVESKGSSLNIDGVNFYILSGLGTAYYVAVDIVNDECNNMPFNIDEYILAHNPLAYIERQLSEDRLYYYITSIPQQNEEPFRFNFIVEK